MKKEFTTVYFKDCADYDYTKTLYFENDATAHDALLGMGFKHSYENVYTNKNMRAKIETLIGKSKLNVYLDKISRLNDYHKPVNLDFHKTCKKLVASRNSVGDLYFMYSYTKIR